MAEVALRVDLTEDLRPLSRFLQENGIRHQISEQGGEQVLWVDTPEAADWVKQSYRQFLAEGLPVAAERQAPPATGRRPAAMPVTLVLIALSLVGAVVATTSHEMMSLLSYYRITVVDQGYVLSTAPREFWRLFTPVFLHFGLLHITFNALWVWELGRRIEFQQGGVWLLLLTVALGVISNLAQVWYTPGQLFGGMSGVIYGYLGYLVVWQRFAPVPAFALPPGIVIFMLAWLVLCMVGFTELLGLGAIANAAHLGGLLAGVAVAGSALFWRRSKPTGDL